MADEIKILDLDAIIPDERKIKINGKEYRIRGDATVEESLKLTKYANDNSSPEAIAALFGAIKSFFIDKIDDKELKTLGIRTQLPLLIQFLFSNTREDVKKN